MRVTLVDPGPQVANYGRALAGALAAAGDRVTLATAPLLYYEPPPLASGVTRVPAFGRLLRPALAARPLARRAARAVGYAIEWPRLVRQLTAERPAVVHLQWSLAPPIDALAARWLRRSGIVVVHTAHNVLPHERRPWHPPAFRALYRAVDGVIVHSAASRARLTALTGRASVRVAVVPMPVTVPARRPSRAAARQRLGLPAAAPIALFFGHVRPYKGLDVLLAAWPTVTDRVPDGQLLVAGPVAGGQKAARRLAAYAARLAGVTLRPGYVATDAVSDHFAAADVVVLPYRAADDSAVLAQALGYGRPVVASNVGGLPALVGEAGLLVPPENPTALAAALVTLLGDRATRARCADAASAIAVERGWEAAAERTRAFYAALGAEHANGASVAGSASQSSRAVR